LYRRAAEAQDDRDEVTGFIDAFQAQARGESRASRRRRRQFGGGASDVHESASTRARADADPR